MNMNRLEVVDADLKIRGWFVKQAIIEKHLSDGSITTDEQFHSYFLNRDIKEFGNEVLNTRVLSQKCLKEDIIVQINKVQNICARPSGTENDDEDEDDISNTRKLLLKLILNDGMTHAESLVMPDDSHMPRFEIGMKIRLSIGVRVINRVLILNMKENCFILGGKVKSLQSKNADKSVLSQVSRCSKTQGPPLWVPFGVSFVQTPITGNAGHKLADIIDTNTSWEESEDFIEKRRQVIDVASLGSGQFTQKRFEPYDLNCGNDCFDIIRKSYDQIYDLCCLRREKKENVGSRRNDCYSGPVLTYADVYGPNSVDVVQQGVQNLDIGIDTSRGRRGRKININEIFSEPPSSSGRGFQLGRGQRRGGRRRFRR
ncbi:hypothetical protein ACOME3_006902 [Neoechinorhynchus agilis]